MPHNMNDKDRIRSCIRTIISKKFKININYTSELLHYSKKSADDMYKIDILSKNIVEGYIKGYKFNTYKGFYEIRLFILTNDKKEHEFLFRINNVFNIEFGNIPKPETGYFKIIYCEENRKKTITIKHIKEEEDPDING